MEDFPRTLLEFERRFATDADCRAYLEQLRWPGGFRCDRCDCELGWRMGNGLWLCRKCRRQVSVKAGTIFQDSRLPLTLWFRAMWYVTSQKNGASAKNVQRLLGLRSYQTAWAWLHKLRRAMVRPGRDQLSGLVEVDESYIGGIESDAIGRKIGHKSLVVIAAEVDGKRIGRIRLRRLKDASAGSLRAFVEDSIRLGSVVQTDGWRGYMPVLHVGYKHQVLKTDKKAEQWILPRVHRISALLQRWLLGTHQGAVEPAHLQYYLDEFTFRFNRRTSHSRGKLFYRLVQQAVEVDPHPYQELIRPQ
jgi:hypothetical protein